MPGMKLRLYECQVTGVQSDHRTISAISRNGTRFEAVTYLLPWISANGAGIDIVPKVGDQCLIAAEPEKVRVEGGSLSVNTSASWRYSICLGFKMPGTPRAGGLFLGDRVSGLPQGSVALRTVSENGDEAMLLLTRGGTALIRVNETCQTIYSPVDSSITNIFDNWELKGPGGHVKWRREEDSEVVKYEAEYKTRVSGDTGFKVNVTIDEGASDPVSFEVNNSNLSPDPLIKIYVDATGQVHIEAQSLYIETQANLNIRSRGTFLINNRLVLGQGDPI